MKYLPLVLLAVVGVAGSAYIGLAEPGGSPPAGRVALVVDVLTLLWWLQFAFQLGRGEAVWPAGDVGRRERPVLYAILMLGWGLAAVALGYAALFLSFIAWFGNPNT